MEIQGTVTRECPSTSELFQNIIKCRSGNLWDGGTRASADRDGINKQKGEKGRRVLIKDYNAKLFGSDWLRLIYYNDTQILLNTHIEAFHQQPKENV